MSKTTMEEKQNPAGALLEYMTAALQKKDCSMLAMWAHVLDCETHQSAKILIGLDHMLRLCDEAEEAAIACAPGKPDKFIKPLSKIKALISSHDLNAAWSLYKGQLDSATMTALEFCDHILQLEYLKTYPAKSDQVHSLLEDLDDLLNQCLDSEMSAELKALFAKNLEELRHALIQYRIGGEQGLKDALDQVAGSILRHNGEIKSEFESAEEFLDKSLGIMGKIEQVVASAQNLAAIASPVTNCLLPFFR